MTLFFAWVVGSVLCGAVALSKNRSFVSWFFISIFLSPLLALIVLFAVPVIPKINRNADIDITNNIQNQSIRYKLEDKKKCPNCLNMINKTIKKCHYCEFTVSYK